MRVPSRWLNEHLRRPLTLDKDEIEEIAQRLTAAGLEVAAIERVGTIEGVSVGQIVSVAPHPKAERLKICEVSLGRDRLKLVSGAPNTVEGAFVPVIRSGGRLPDGRVLETADFKGEKSEGMILSRAELGLEEKSPGIWLLERELKLSLGADLAQFLEFDDYILVLETKSNRPDALSVLGIAREVSALYNIELKRPVFTVRESGNSIQERAAVEILDPEGCPRYSARLFSDIALGPSPLKIQHRLAKAGMRPINTIVDATNYVLLELGHPTHAFDCDRLTERRIVVRRARRDEKIQTLDGVERALLESDLVIADAKKPVALAGIMGGAESEVSAQTKTILLESAYFDPITIRRTAKRLGLRTEASHRFERDMDPEITLTALDRVGALLQAQERCAIAPGVLDLYPQRFARRFAPLRLSRVEKILGASIPSETAERILSQLEFGVERESSDRWRVEIPSFRREVEREIDLIEEIGRIYGYDQISPQRPAFPLVAGRRDHVEELKDRIRKILTGLGLSEAVNFGLISTEDLKMIGNQHQYLSVRNPMSDETVALRPSLWPNLLRNVQHNAYQHVDGVRLFELGKVFTREQNACRERLMLGMALAGRALVPLKGNAQIYDFYDLKGIVETLLMELGFRNFTFEPSAEELLHSSRQAFLRAKDDTLGLMGELHPNIAQRYDIPWRVYLFELNLEEIHQRLQTLTLPIWSEIQQRVTPRYPASRRDLSLLVPESVPEVNVRRILEGERRVERVFLYDLYRGSQIPQEMKSLTYEITFRDWSKTLSDDEVNEMVARMEARLRDELGAQIRKL
jgi:phenylalanyl-tRNA synthetase beta chain